MPFTRQHNCFVHTSHFVSVLKHFLKDFIKYIYCLLRTFLNETGLKIPFFVSMCGEEHNDYSYSRCHAVIFAKAPVVLPKTV